MTTATIQPNGQFPIVDVNYTIVNGFISFNYNGHRYIIDINYGIDTDTRYQYTYDNCHVWFIGRDSDPNAFFVRIPISDFND